MAQLPPEQIAALLDDRTKKWTVEQRRMLIKQLRAAKTRRGIVLHNQHPAQLARYCDPTYVITPAVELVSRSIERVLREPSRHLLVTAPPQELKLLSDSTLVPTPQGWSKHGDLCVGDQLFHPSGKVIQVVAVHPKSFADYTVEITNHDSFTVNGDHLWTVFDRSVKTWRTVSTRYLAGIKTDSGAPGRGHRYRFMLPFHETLACGPDIDLPIDPYTLGVWLGNGSVGKGCVTHAAEDVYPIPFPIGSQNIHADTGVITTYYTGLSATLRRAGVLGTKHIPAKYLRASEQQRRSLLAGLIDTDGHVTVSGQVSFDNTNEKMVRDTAELIRTLGYRAHVHRPTPAKSVQYKDQIINGNLPMWRVTFTTHDGIDPARLERKQRTKCTVRRKAAIARVTPTAPVRGNCITVSAEDGLYLVGENFTPTHNSTLCAVWTPIRALQLHPDWNIMVLSYADSLAEAHSFTMRQAIEMYGSGATDTFTGQPLPDKLGISLLHERNAVGRWRIQEGKGGLVAAGLRATVTGLPANLIIVDDPYKGPMEADSAAIREHVLDIFRSVVRTRLAPGGSVVLVQTRWNPEDLAGFIIKDQSGRPAGERTWRYINIPAFSHPGVPDSLKRPEPGTFMESARGRTPAEFEETRKVLGERFWWAMYMGVPTPPEGGLFVKEWFDNHRLDSEPDVTLMRVVAVDPAETGERDEAGVVAASLMRDGTVALTRDKSGAMTSDQWAIAAVDLAVSTGATQIHVEAYTAGTTYVNVIKKAIKAKMGTLVDHSTDTAEQCMQLYNARAALSALTVVAWRGKGDAVARSVLLRQAVEVGTCRVVADEMDVMIDQAVSWQQHSHQPDRVAASVIAHGVLSEMMSRKTGLASPLKSIQNGRDTGWLARSVG